MWRFTKVPRLIMRSWDRLQVELQGQYSVERLYRLNQYTDNTSILHVLMVILLTPIPSLLYLILIDCIPLQPPAIGLEHSQLFWVRNTLNGVIVCLCIFQTFHILLPELPLSNRQHIGISLLAGGICTLGVYHLAKWIKYPLPLHYIGMGIMLMVVLLPSMILMWRKKLLEKQSLWHQLQLHQVIVNILLLLIFVYNGYTYVFKKLSASSQVWFALLLPLTKLLIKNILNPLCKDIEDDKPETVVLNVEIFHALYIASSIQTSSSKQTTLVLMLVDGIQMYLSLRDIAMVTRRLRVIQGRAATFKKNTVGDTAAVLNGKIFTQTLLLVKNDGNVRNSREFRLQSRKQSAIQAMNTVTGLQLQGFTPQTLIFPSCETETNSQFNSLTKQQRIKYVKLTLKLLHMVEFFILIEFLEVALPVVYCK